MSYFSLHSAVHENNIQQFEKYLIDNCGKRLPADIENYIIVNHMKQFINLMIKYKCYDTQTLQLSGMFDIDQQVLIKLQDVR